MDTVVEMDEDPGSAFDGKTNGILTPSFVSLFVWAILVFGVLLAFITRYRSRLNFIGQTVTITEDELKKRQALEASRVKMQERLDAEVERRKAKLEVGKDRTTVNGNESIKDTGEVEKLVGILSKGRNGEKRPTKASFRANDYNPLMNNYSSSCHYRPPGRLGPRGG